MVGKSACKDVLYTSGASWMMPVGCFGFETRWDRIVLFLHLVDNFLFYTND